jgi:integrase
MNDCARKVLLPQFTLTEVTDESDPAAEKITLPDDGCYFIKPKLIPGETFRRDGKPLWVPRQFYTYPVVLKKDGSPWDEANVWIQNQLEQKFDFNISTFISHAEDLTAFLKFIDERKIDWLDFPNRKHLKPTYRYRGYLVAEVSYGNIQWATAKRRLATVIRFYRWLILKKFIELESEPWIDGEAYISITDEIGKSSVLKIKTTDVSIRVPQSDNPYDDRIDDQGKLRPLSQEEQAWLMDALTHHGNTEMTLIHLLAWLTGARIQTVLTFRVSHVTRQHPRNKEVRIVCGPGTEINTKFNKKLMLFIPFWLYQMLQTYALSERAKKRRKKAVGGDTEQQYLFLSQYGTPMYESRQDDEFSRSAKRRHKKNGQAVRMYMTKFLIPYIRKKYDDRFNYQFHDLRATFGMNLVDERKILMDKGELTYTQVLDYVRQRMGHKSPVITERYLQYRNRIKSFPKIQDQWEQNIERMAYETIRGLDD